MGEGKRVSTGRARDQPLRGHRRRSSEKVFHAVDEAIAIGIVTEVLIGNSEAEGGLGDPVGEGVSGGRSCEVPRGRVGESGKGVSTRSINDRA